MSLLLAAALALSPGATLTGFAEPRPGPADPVSGLAVESDPPGASLYVDGQFAGQTPANLNHLPAGDHRVRLVKTGYLENGRVVTVGEGRPTSVRVKLTPTAAAGEQAAQSAGGGGSKKWLWIGLAGGGATVATVLLLKSGNKAPVAGTTSVSPATALQGTNVTFTSQGASDPDGDSLTYTWNFGDGGTGTGASATHVYATSGTFNVSVKVSDGKKDATATGSATVKSLTGTWKGLVSGACGSFTATYILTQSATNVTGSYSDTANFLATVSGTVSTTSPNITLNDNYFSPVVYTGTYKATPGSDVNTMSGTYTELGSTCTSTLTRQ